MEKYLAIYENGFTKSRKRFMITSILEEIIPNNGIEEEFDEACKEWGHKPYYTPQENDGLEDLTDDVIWDIFFDDMTSFVGIDDEVDEILVENGYLPYYQMLYEMYDQYPELQDQIIEINNELGLPLKPEE